MRIWVSVLLLILFQPYVCAAYTDHHPYYLSISRSSGLPSNEVYDMCEDDDGFMWLATGSGLYRYDGFSFVQWQSDMQTSAAGSCVRKDRFGRIWYENFDGFLYYTEGKILRPLQQKRPKAYMPFGITNKYLFVLQPEGVDVFDIKELSKVHTVNLNLKRLEHSTCTNGSYYVAADGIVYKIDSNLEISSYICPDRKIVSVHQLFVLGDSLFVAPRLSGASTITVLNGMLRPVHQVSVTTSGYFRGIEKIGIDTWLYTSLGSTVRQAGNENIESVLFAGKSISKVLRDRNGNYWFATTNEGIYIVPDLRSTVHKYNDTKMRQVVVTGSGVLTGTHTGEILCQRAKNGRMAELSRDKNGAEVYYLFADDHNIIYSATGYTILGNSTKSEIRMADLAIKEVVAIDSKYYAIAASGMCLLMPKPHVANSSASLWDDLAGLHKYTGIDGSTILLDGIRTRSVAYDSSSHTIYCATNSGIVAIDIHGSRQVNYNGQPIYAAKLATLGSYIYIADTKGKILRINSKRHVEDLDWFPGNGQIRLLKAQRGKIFYCSGKQLYEYAGTDTVQRVDVRIDAEEINDFAVSDSCLWLATNAGLVSFVRDMRNARDQPPHFFINTIMVNEEEVDSSCLQNLPFNKNNIAIAYSLVEFAVAVPSTISYKVNDGEWKELPGNMRTLHFRSLSPGKYSVLFAVNGKDTVKKITFSISPPFWQQLWFYFFCVLAVLFIVLAYYSYRMKARVRKVEEQQDKLRLEERLSRSMLTALRSQMNPHFFFNALNTVQAYIFTNDKIKASDYLAKLSLLTRTILEMSEAETVMLSDEIDALTLYLDIEKARFGDEFNYAILLHGINDPQAHEIPSMIIQPFVENAVKHGLLHKEGTKNVELRFSLHDNMLNITIDDNGIGQARSKALNEIKNKRHKPYSTRATNERVKLLNAGNPGLLSIEVSDKSTADGIPLGTTVTIKIKLA